jgi:hypothetical protein
MKPEENKEVSERVKFKGREEIMKVGKINTRAEKTGNYTKSLETIGKSAVCGDKDSKLDN